MEFLPQLRHRFANAVLSAAYLGLAVPVYEARQTWLRLSVLSVLIGISLIAWVLAFRRYHTIVDTPTAKIQSAPQGYVELQGYGSLLPGAVPLGFGSTPPCIWYRYRVLHDGKQIDSGQSHDTFLLRDGTGECVIDPDLAEIACSTRKTTRRDSYVTHIDYLRVDAPLHAIGEFSTLGGTELTLNRNQDVRELLGEWKNDPNRLLERFDRNGDGEISLTEWQTARRAAREAIDQRHAEMRLRPDTHILRAPKDGRPFLLSSIDPQKLAGRFRLWCWFHATVCVAGFATIPLLVLT